MATAAAAVIAVAQQSVVSRFTAADAVTPDCAVAYAPGERSQQWMFDKLRRAGVIVETAPGDYYLDVAAYDAHRRKERRTVAIVVGGIMAISAALIALA